MNDSVVTFNNGVQYDRVFAHRGDIFICDGLFKNMKDVDKDDCIIGKENRPVLVISDDPYNIHIVKVLPLSSQQGNTLNLESLSFGRLVKIPPIKENHKEPSYIDVSQVFTINQYQLKIKIAKVSQEIVDTAVALNLLYNMNSKSVNTIVRFIQEEYPCANVFKSNNSTYTIDDTRNPNEQIYSKTERVSIQELNKYRNEIDDKVKVLFDSIKTIDDAKKYFEEWKMMGTDIFRYNYGLSHQQYHTFRSICISKMLGKVNNFNRFDWNS